MNETLARQEAYAASGFGHGLADRGVVGRTDGPHFPDRRRPCWIAERVPYRKSLGRLFRGVHQAIGEFHGSSRSAWSLVEHRNADAEANPPLPQASHPPQLVLQLVDDE